MDKITITLDRNDLGQILDGLTILEEQWAATERFLRTGEVEEDACIREEHRAERAEAMRDSYGRIAAGLWPQLHVGRG